MPIPVKLLPPKVYLTDYNGDFHRYIDAVYDVFAKDFVFSKPHIGDIKFNLKYHPQYQNRAYTFYHMTHEGHDESNRTPDLRRCERISWCRPTIEQTATFSLKFWEETRKGHSRVCIWMAVEDDETGDAYENNYFVVLEVRQEYVLPWTAFCARYKNDIEKKQKEYEKWKRDVGDKDYTLYTLIREIMARHKKQGPPGKQTTP